MKDRLPEIDRRDLLYTVKAARDEIEGYIESIRIITEDLAPASLSDIHDRAPAVVVVMEDADHILRKFDRAIIQLKEMEDVNLG